MRQPIGNVDDAQAGRERQEPPTTAVSQRREAEPGDDDEREAREPRSEGERGREGNAAQPILDGASRRVVESEKVMRGFVRNMHCEREAQREPRMTESAVRGWVV